MGKFYDDSGEVLEFVGREQHTIRGVLETDGMGREWIANSNADEPSLELGEILGEIEPDSINNPETDGEEYRFRISVDIHKPTGEYHGEA